MDVAGPIGMMANDWVELHTSEGRTTRLYTKRLQDRSYEDNPHLIVFDDGDRLTLNERIQMASNRKVGLDRRERVMVFAFGGLAAVGTMVAAVASVVDLVMRLHG